MKTSKKFTDSLNGNGTALNKKQNHVLKDFKNWEAAASVFITISYVDAYLCFCNHC
jgi:hypothetical protein